MSVSVKVSEFVKSLKKPYRMTPEEYARKLISKGLNPDGTPVLDPRPLAPPIGYKRQPTMVELIRDMVRSEKLAQEAAAAGAETFEESEDFDIDDEPGYATSPWVNDFDPSVGDLASALDQEKAEREQRRKARFEYWEDRREFARQAQEAAPGSAADAAPARGGPGSQSGPSASAPSTDEGRSN